MRTSLLPFTLISFALASLLAASGCKLLDRSSDMATDGGDDVATVDAGTDTGSSTPNNRAPLGVRCGSGAECQSGFCIDGVCCESDCSETCYGCAESGSRGFCAPINQREDPSAMHPCEDGSRCIVDTAGTPTCKLNDKESCSSNDACASGLCRTYFIDADHDGYGVSASYESICDTTAATVPKGYAAIGGDCCDSDDGSNPGVSSAAFFAAPNACGSFDWDCNGVVQRQTAAACPGSSGTAQVACGVTCYATVLGTTSKFFTQECR